MTVYINEGNLPHSFMVLVVRNNEHHFVFVFAVLKHIKHGESNRNGW